MSKFGFIKDAKDDGTSDFAEKYPNNEPNNVPHYCDGCDEWYKAAYMAANLKKCIRCDSRLEVHSGDGGIYVILNDEKVYIEKFN